jgi:hypothetical protein
LHAANAVRQSSLPHHRQTTTLVSASILLFSSILNIKLQRKINTSVVKGRERGETANFPPRYCTMRKFTIQRIRTSHIKEATTIIQPAGHPQNIFPPLAPSQPQTVHFIIHVPEGSLIVGHVRKTRRRSVENVELMFIYSSHHLSSISRHMSYQTLNANESRRPSSLTLCEFSKWSPWWSLWSWRKVQGRN